MDLGILEPSWTGPASPPADPRVVDAATSARLVEVRGDGISAVGRILSVDHALLFAPAASARPPAVGEVLEVSWEVGTYRHTFRSELLGWDAVGRWRLARPRSAWMSERRGEPRFNVYGEVGVSFRVKSWPAQPLLGVYDVSRGGVALVRARGRQPLLPGESIVGVLYLSGEVPMPARLVIRHARVMPGRSDLLLFGARAEWMDDDAPERVLSWVAERLIPVTTTP